MLTTQKKELIQSLKLQPGQDKNEDNTCNPMTGVEDSQTHLAGPLLPVSPPYWVSSKGYTRSSCPLLRMSRDFRAGHFWKALQFVLQNYAPCWDHYKYGWSVASLNIVQGERPGPNDNILRLGGEPTPLLDSSL